VVQFTPPGSESSMIIGNGITEAAPGSLQGLQLVAYDIEAARDELGDYASLATFTDPDGNGWVLQEVRQRGPGR
jgi:hypothetical protein